MQDTRDRYSRQQRRGIMSSPVQPDRMLQFFSYLHLPPDLQKVSKLFCELAHQICQDLPSNPERTVALRKLLEAKDCAVRAVIYKG
jgi:hypothetical protein